MKKIIVCLLLMLVMSGCSYKGASLLGGRKDEATGKTEGVRIDMKSQSLKNLPGELFGRDNVISFDVSNNLLTGALPSEIGKWKKLTLLDVSDNKMTGIPAEIGQLTELSSLDYSNNMLDTMPNEIVGLKKLKTFSLAGNLYRDVPSQLLQMPNLGLLDLSRNKLAVLPEDLSGWKNLRVLIVGGNPLSATDLSRLKKSLPDTQVVY
ncbi:hypothetical protein HGA64_02380 [Candidatus Falkowbacteria bacterium]|nr:hypothetical protein [Candidatus Falkowbacteria bacterium]